jgi:phospholipase/carboxylesterase
MKRSVFAIALIGFVSLATYWLWLQGAPLSAITRGGAGPPTVVLLHGYGSRAEDWLQFEQQWQFPSGTRRVYPQAPWRGFGSHHGWWWLHLESYLKNGEPLPDMSASNPGGLKASARQVRELIKGEKVPLILGGFSQGAMVSAEIAFQTDQQLDGLVLLSGTTLNEEAWAEHFAGRRHLPIFIAHGRRDPTLSFAIIERFQARLVALGMDVTWFPFDGGHEIPLTVVNEVNRFVDRVVGLQSTAGRH